MAARPRSRRRRTEELTYATVPAPSAETAGTSHGDTRTHADNSTEEIRVSTGCLVTSGCRLWVGRGYHWTRQPCSRHSIGTQNQTQQDVLSSAAIRPDRQ